jgi:hypothetical protein
VILQQLEAVKQELGLERQKTAVSQSLKLRSYSNIDMVWIKRLEKLSRLQAGHNPQGQWSGGSNATDERMDLDASPLSETALGKRPKHLVLPRTPVSCPTIFGAPCSH